MEYLVEREEWTDAVEEILQLVNDEAFKSEKGTTKHQLWIQLCDIFSKHSNKISKRIKVEEILRAGLTKFSENVGKLWTTLAEYHIRLGNFEKARDVFEEGMSKVIQINDFSQIWDGYAKFEDTLISEQINEGLNN